MPFDPEIPPLRIYTKKISKDTGTQRCKNKEILFRGWIIIMKE